MARLTVITHAGTSEVPFASGPSLREILDASGVPVRSGCRGNGACGLCVVRITAGTVNDPTDNERAIIPSGQLDQGVRLACQVVPGNDLCVRIVRPVSESEESGLTASTLNLSAALFEAFIKLAQYIVRIKIQEDLWNHLGRFIMTHFPAEWTGLAQRDPAAGISVSPCTLPDEVITEPLFIDKVRTLVSEVLDTGFLACEVISTPSPSMTVFLPIMEEYRPTKVMLIGHESAASLPKELLNIYLAIASLTGTTCERIQSERELNRHRANLEGMVKERTAELEAANKELEAFSYSVSHDLRSPLRSIDGFSQILLEDYDGKLDAGVVDSLRRIREASRRMGLLIDGLLSLSRISRAALKRERVSLSDLVRDLARVLEETERNREVEFVIEEELVAEGDERLLYAALQNLIGNAWKFTQRKLNPRIEFGALEKDGEFAYFVRDNGAGFDMAYSNKLFSLFQRLHDPAEFSGTGIGLATVQRIIHRHGGRLWGEGEVGKGATFYFTLG